MSRRVNMIWVHFLKAGFFRQRDRGTTERTIVIAITVLLAVIAWEISRRPTLTPVIFTSEGPVQGAVKVSRDGKPYWAFLGIPYGEPPVGSRKFSAPRPKTPWSSVKKVTSFPVVCAQYDTIATFRITGQLDCLYLNVFVNVAAGKWKSAEKPVLVYIHGGAFSSWGTTFYHPEYLMDQDIVLVTFNYRLGPIGFLNLQNSTNPTTGNAGLLDQHLVLQWVQRNIGHFGGDNKKVLLFGESAGAASTHLHVMSPMSQGLFQKALIQSGTALPAWAISRSPRTIAKNYAKKVGCPSDDDDSVLKCFHRKDWRELTRHQSSIPVPLDEKDLFTPSLDGKFVQKTPFENLRDGSFQTVPIMFGVNANDGNIRTSRFEAWPELIEKLDRDWDNQVTNAMLFDTPIPAEHAKVLRRKYFSEKFTNDPDGFLKNFTKIGTEGGFYFPMHLAALAHANAGAQTYVYFYNYTSNILPNGYRVFKVRGSAWLPIEFHILASLMIDAVNLFIFGKDTYFGVGHGDDVFQMWNWQGFSHWFAGPDAKFSRAFIKAVVDFANNTEPLHFDGLIWPPINDHILSGGSNDTIPFMLMDNNLPKVIPEPFADCLEFWEKVSTWGYYN